MGAVSVVLGGVIGFIFATVLYFSGVGLLWTLVGYAVAGNVVVAVLMARYYRNARHWEQALAREIAADMEALREYREAEAAKECAPILFRSLRLQEQMNARAGAPRRSKLW